MQSVTVVLCCKGDENCLLQCSQADSGTQDQSCIGSFELAVLVGIGNLCLSVIIQMNPV